MPLLGDAGRIQQIIVNYVSNALNADGGNIRLSVNIPDGAPGELFLLNRIDSPTSGLVLAALDEATAIQGREAFANGQVQKVYFALVIGRPRPPQGVWSDRLVRQPAHGHGHGHGPGRGHGHGGVRVMPAAASAPGQLAKTNYECLESLHKIKFPD